MTYDTCTSTLIEQFLNIHFFETIDFVVRYDFIMFNYTALI